MIHEADIARLKEFAAYRQQTFAQNAVSDGQKLWITAPGDKQIYTLKPDSRINVVLLQEDISHGQRIEQFNLEALVNGKWEPIGKGTTVGYKRMIRFPEIKADAIRLHIEESRLDARINNVAAYYATPLSEQQTTSSWNDLPRTAWKKFPINP